MRSKIAIISLCFFVGLTFSGCASIVKGRTQEVSFQSNPDTATVKIDGKIIGKTPMTVNLHRKSGQTIVFEKEGYDPISMKLETTMNGWFWGNIVLGGLVGSTTDGVTGAVYEYSPSQYMVSLQHNSENNLDNQKTQSEQVKDFVVIGYNNLIKDINNGSGQYLASLFDLLKVNERGQIAALKKIRKLSRDYKNIVEFANQINSAFHVKN